MAEEHEFDVEEAHAGQRLDVYLAERLTLSRARIQKLIDEGRVHVDGETPPKAGVKLKAGEAIEVEVPDPVPLDLVGEDLDLDVLYEDDDVLVVNKPPGMPVHPGPGHPTGTLVHGLLGRGTQWSGVGGVERPGIVHRIDKDTSGVLVVAKSDDAHRALSAQFAAHTSERVYIAIVRGEPAPSGTIDAPIGRDPNQRKRLSVVEAARGKRAVTHFKRTQQLKGCAVLEVRLETGRTHQIRVHLAHKRWPVIGDVVYARKHEPWADRQMLHARSLGFDHPRTGERVTFTTELPADMVELIARCS